MWETVTVSQLLSIVLGYLGTGNAFEDMKFINAVSPQSWNYCFADMYTAWQVDGS